MRIGGRSHGKTAALMEAAAEHAERGGTAYMMSPDGEGGVRATRLLNPQDAYYGGASGHGSSDPRMIAVMNASITAATERAQSSTGVPFDVSSGKRGR